MGPVYPELIIGTSGKLFIKMREIAAKFFSKKGLTVCLVLLSTKRIAVVILNQDKKIM
jgi:hypothetical protein